ncbi:MAG: 4-hydroxy-tetrahydrodipicolinate reductase [Planctomycetota bacterium]
MITIGINGAAGRMGLSLIRLIPEFKDLKLVAAIERPDYRRIGEDVGVIAGINVGGIGVRVSSKLDKKADVVIDFSTPSATMNILKSCLKYKSALLIGTTGLSKQQINHIRSAGKKIPCLISPNMSLGANVMFKVAPEIAAILGSNYDMEIVETHHRFKKDAPSGTAIRLADSITNKSGKKIPIHSLRIGDVVGDHSVIFSTLGERIELIHRVHTRDIFSRGALYTARFIAKSKPGLYTMIDIIKMRNKILDK